MLPAILLVDDEEEILDFLERSLRESYTIFRTGDPTAAIPILTKEVILLVISDVIMPEMDGFQLCKEIKSRVEFAHIPVILLTAKNTIQAKVQGLELGADAYIEKPFSPRYLAAQAASLIANRLRLKEYFAHSPLVHIRSMAYTRTEEAFLESLNETIVAHMDNADLDIELLARTLNMSRATLYRKIKAISDLAPVEFINIIRLKRAAVLLAEGDLKIYEVASMTGFSSQSNFTRNFHKQFQMTPSDYLRDKQEERRANDRGVQ
jgi:two-component system cell cycle response regulator